jgi:RND superfamily putative drug exporter
MSGLLAVPKITGVVATMLGLGLGLGLGVGIDYALFILARPRQNLAAAGQSFPVAIGRANATNRRSVGALRLASRSSSRSSA